MTLDLIIICAYFCAIFSIGLYVGRRQNSLESYALGNRSMPWWAILASIIAAEISAATFLGTPGEGYALRNFTYVQLGIGTLLGRIIVGKLFLQPYYRYRVVSIYEYLQKRFGVTTRRCASITFLISRVLASGTRLYIAGILLVIAYAFITGQESASETETIIIYFVALTLITVATAVYTTLGGLKAVVWTDVLQASILVIAVLTTIIYLLLGIRGDGSWLEAWQSICASVGDRTADPCKVGNVQPWKLFDLGITGEGFVADVKNILGSEYTLWTAFLGSTFLTMATHGTDQDMVQRMLAAKDRQTGTRAVIMSGIMDIPIVIIFLTCGILLYAFHAKTGFFLPEKSSEIFPYFIVHYLPAGIRGLLVAALLATAMGSLSTALNALATTATRDWYRDVFRPKATEQQQLRAVRLLTVAFALLLILVGCATAWYSVKDPSVRIIPIALGIFGYTYGSLLGVFLLGMLTKGRGCDFGNVLAMLAGFAVVVLLEVGKHGGWVTGIAFPWRVTIGTLVTFAVGCCFRSPASVAPPGAPDELEHEKES